VAGYLQRDVHVISTRETQVAPCGKLSREGSVYAVS
jgi:hypothetical protein